MLSLASPRPRRRPSLTPMIDVVFLLLVFFMLAAKFGTDQSIALRQGGGAAEYSGPPRLIETTADGVLVNGIEVGDEDLLAAIKPLTEDSTDVLVLRSRDEADTQRLVDVLLLLHEGGFSNVALVE